MLCSVNSVMQIGINALLSSAHASEQISQAEGIQHAEVSTRCWEECPKVLPQSPIAPQVYSHRLSVFSKSTPTVCSSAWFLPLAAFCFSAATCRHSSESAFIWAAYSGVMCSCTPGHTPTHETRTLHAP